MAATQTADERIIDAVTSWPGAEAVDGARGHVSLRLGRRELGHLHGDRVAHFAFPKAIAAQLRAEGRVVRHPIDSPGLAARRLETRQDADDVIELMRMNYDRAVARHGLPT
jgi:hypothetical protein